MCVYNTYLDDVFVGPTLVRLVILCILEQHFVHVGAGILEQFITTVEYDQRYLAVAEYAEFVSFLHQTKFPLGKGDLYRGCKNRRWGDGNQQSARMSMLFV